MTGGLARPRTIAGAHEIPRVGWHERIGLVGVGPDTAGLAGFGATKGRSGWSIPRARTVSLSGLERWLPRSARIELTPRVVDLIPSSSWCASLANMLSASSWKVVRDVATAFAGACSDCGAMTPLDCHEIWEYDDGRLVQRLVELRALCGPCHETHHLGLASVRGRYAAVLARLVAMERLLPHEVPEYESEVFARFERRSASSWTLDLALVAGHRLSLARSFERTGPGAVRGAGRSGRIEARFIGVEVVAGPRCLLLV